MLTQEEEFVIIFAMVIIFCVFIFGFTIWFIFRSGSESNKRRDEFLNELKRSNDLKEKELKMKEVISNDKSG